MLRTFLAAVVVLGCASALGAQDVVKPRPSSGKGGMAGTFPNEKIEAAGKTREYRLVVPKSVDPAKPAPVVFAFHGFLIDSKDVMPVYSQLDKLAEKEGFILAYLNAVNKAWPLIVDWAKDDLAFFDALAAHIAGKHNVDLNRVYLAGMSNGAYFCHVVASQRSDKVAAIACHSGGLGFLALGDPKVKNKYAVIAIHGDKDAIVKVDESRKVRDAYQKWGHPVEYVEVPNWNHLWAGNINVNDKIWKFFEAHPLK